MPEEELLGPAIVFPYEPPQLRVMLRIEDPNVLWEGPEAPTRRQTIRRDKKSSGDRNGNFGTSEKKVPVDYL